MGEEKGQRKILLIDDDPSIIKLTESVLKSKGYEVDVATEAPLGLEKALKGSPDLIVLDVMMPIINGFNVCRLVKSEEDHKHIPIILLTSRTEDEDKKIGEEVGADAYIEKPLNTEEFLNTVQNLLQNN